MLMASHFIKVTCGLLEKHKTRTEVESCYGFLDSVRIKRIAITKCGQFFHYRNAKEI